MSLSRDPVLSLLRDDLVCGWRDISKEAYCGRSHEHGTANPAVETTNGAGPHNTQLFLLSADGTVLHCLPGYWDPRDLAGEIALAKELDKVWTDSSLTREEKDAKWKELQLGHLAKHSQAMVDRSLMQGFDAKFEKKTRPDTSDCILREGSLQPVLRPKKKGLSEYKTTDQILHERMAARPFVPYEKFDTAKFSDYGRPLYDKKMDDCGESLGPGGKMKKKDKEKAKAAE